MRHWGVVIVVPACRRELEALPDEVRGDLKKTTQATPLRHTDLARKRMKEVSR